MIFLLGQLRTREIESQHVTTFLIPERYFLEGVAQRFIEIARQSLEERARVIKALARIVDDPGAQTEMLFATRWHFAIRVLADMKAVEAIDVLVKDIRVTGLTAIVLMNHRPVFSAVISIGRPAVPRLTQTLSEDDAAVRRDSVYALGEIGGSDAKKALEQALKKEADEDTQKAISSALTNIAYSNIIAD